MKQLNRKVLFALNLQDYMTARNKTRSEVSKDTGIPYSTLSDWLQATKLPRPDTLDVLANYLNVTVADLMGDRIYGASSEQANLIKANELYIKEKFPESDSVESQAVGSAFVDADFALRCKNDDLINARVKAGDTVFVRKQTTAKNGDLVALSVDKQTMLRRYIKYDDHIVLQPENPNLRPLTFWEEDMQRVQILGKAIAFISRIK